MPKCECPEEGVLDPMMAGAYDPVTELPFVKHEPGKCQCTNNVRQFKRGGKLLWLCSNCWLTGDFNVKEEDNA